jgi:rhamnogalacturonan endolyase
MFLSAVLVALTALAAPALAAFGITTSSSSYVIDAGSANPLIVTINRSSCDITSIKYYGTEMQYSSQGSHISSGLGSATVNAQVVNSKRDFSLL